MSSQKKTAGWQPCASSKAKTSSYGLHSKRSHTHGQRVHKGKLPTPFFYFSRQFPGLHASGEWVNVRCCFHSDNNPSLSLNLVSGGFFCHACGAKGGDLIAFHRQHFGLDFPTAVAQLIKIRMGELK